MKKKKVCVIGAGYWGRNHIKTLSDLDSLGAVVESNEEALKLSLKKYPNINGYKNIEDALKDGYDGYIIATPAETHYGLASKIIDSSYPFLVEKPMTLTIEEAEDLVNKALKKDINFMVGHVLLFHPAIIKIKELISDGKIGKLQYLYSNRLNLGKVRTEENVFWSFAPHDIAIFQYLTNSFPRIVETNGSAIIQKNIHDTTLTYFEYESGVMGHVFVSWLHPFKEHRIIIVGSDAMISFEDSVDDKPLKFYPKGFEVKNGIPEKIDGPVELIDYQNKMPLTSELEYFLQHIDDKSFEIADMHHGLDVVKILVKTGEQLN